MAWKTLDDVALAGKTVLVRVDINVPMDAGKVTDATRIEKIVPTVEDIIARGGKVVLLAHFDRPKGKVVPEMSLRHVVPALEAATGRKVVFGADCVGDAARAAIAAAGPGDVVLLENTRFHAGEEKNDPELAHGMAALGDVYVNDAFSAAHRAHASTAGIAGMLPTAAGRLMEAELRALEAALSGPFAKTYEEAQPHFARHRALHAHLPALPLRAVKARAAAILVRCLNAHATIHARRGLSCGASGD